MIIFWLCLLFWQDLQDLMLLDGMCILIQYFTDVVVSLILKWLGC
jgi:hypothetical protein